MVASTTPLEMAPKSPAENLEPVDEPLKRVTGQRTL